MQNNSSCKLPVSVFVLSVLTSGLAQSVQAENWASWRGPTQNGISISKNAPVEWGTEKNVAWKLSLPGPGGATPVVWGNRLFVTSVDGNNLLLQCVDTNSGQVTWTKKVGTGNKDVRGDEGNAAAPSPVTDGKYVWSMMANGEIGCYDFAGNEIWKMDLQDRYGKFNIAFGMTSTPVLYDRKLYFQFIHGDGNTETQEALVACMDAKTGKAIWQEDRVTGASKENEHSYASPSLYNDGKLKFLITHGADFVIAHDLKDGHEIWRCGGLNPHDDPKRPYHPTLRFVASPSAVPGMIVVPTAKNGPVFAIRPDSKGDITHKKAAHIWTRAQNTPDVPSPLIYDGLVYLCRENGNLICLEADSGKELYEERTTRDRHRASPLFADGKIYLTARKGIVTVVKAGSKFEILAQNDIGEGIAASPIIANGTLYLRSFATLWAIRSGK